MLSKPKAGRVWLSWGRYALLLAVLAAGAVAGLPPLSEALAQEAPATLGLIVISVGGSSDDYGYESGEYGSLVSGTWPGELFNDGNDRAVDAIKEDGDGHWYFIYSRGATYDWQSDQEQLNEITVDVTYEDGIDDRSFVLGGFISQRSGNYTLELAPPLPSRDWADRNGEEIAFEFRRHRPQAEPPVLPPELTNPTATATSFVEFLTETTPGGPVMAQTLIVILVYLMFILRAPATPWGVMLSAIVLILTPWIPVVFGYGSTIAAAIILANVGSGAFTYKAFVARTES